MRNHLKLLEINYSKLFELFKYWNNYSCISDLWISARGSLDALSFRISESPSSSASLGVWLLNRCYAGSYKRVLRKCILDSDTLQWSSVPTRYHALNRNRGARKRWRACIHPAPFCAVNFPSRWKQHGSASTLADRLSLFFAIRSSIDPSISADQAANTMLIDEDLYPPSHKTVIKLR